MSKILSIDIFKSKINVKELQFKYILNKLIIINN